jgi:hypothetical protein
MLPYIASIENGRFACFCCGMIFQTPSINEGSRPRHRRQEAVTALRARGFVHGRRPLDALIRCRRGRARRARVRGYERHLVQLSPHRPVRERASRTSARAALQARTARARSRCTLAASQLALAPAVRRSRMPGAWRRSGAAKLAQDAAAAAAASESREGDAPVPAPAPAKDGKTEGGEKLSAFFNWVAEQVPADPLARVYAYGSSPQSLQSCSRSTRVRQRSAQSACG